ncbi:MAG TPA: hypothetical protein DCY20_08295 [Firmicutes bacterium]|nr:hypothetical protein [Bacillota bacterium]
MPLLVLVALFQKISWRRDLKFAAREKFTGNAWTKLSLCVLGLILVDAVISAVMSMLPFGIFFFNVLFVGFVTYGVIDVANKIKRGEDFTFSDFFPFQDLSRVVLLTIIQNIYLFGWGLLLVVPGIIKSFSYSQTYFILCENPTMPTDEIILQSRQMMDGHKWELFILKASFIGWAIFATFTFGIAGLYILPLYIMSLYMFHDYVKKGYYKSRKHDNVYTIYN